MPRTIPNSMKLQTAALTDSAHDEIADRAHELWIRHGRGDGSAEQDWFEAEQELRAMKVSQSTRRINDESGTVQR